MKEKAVIIDKNNPSIEFIEEKCINCGLCKRICEERIGIKNEKDTEICVNCGQCIQFCPTAALTSKNRIDKFEKAKKQGKKTIVYIAPSVRVAIGDELGLEKGQFELGKLISALRKIGFEHVLDVTFGADLTIIEEANELIYRIKNNKYLPMFTSCCPSWIKYAEIYYPDILKHISTCKSPISMQGPAVMKYFLDKKDIKEDEAFTCAITPCTSKKYEIDRKELYGTDLVITTKELSDYIKKLNIDFNNLEESSFDDLFKEGSGGGTIFGVTGGVMESSLRSAYKIMGDNRSVDFSSIRGYEKNIKEAVFKLGEYEINVAVVHKLSEAKQILEDVKNGASKYHYIEIMSCQGGCIGGGGQPKQKPGIINEKETKEKRIQSLYNRDDEVEIKNCLENEDIIKLYQDYVGEPLGKLAEEMFHTVYNDKSDILK